MKVIFLDIDGVLNCKRTRNPRKLPYVVEPKLLKRLKQLLRQTRAKVVLTSTWRYDPAGMFSARHWGIPFIDVTPEMPKQPRSKEILAWLKTHPGVTRFVVIDDDDDALDGLPLFQPSAWTGLSPEIVRGVVDYLHEKRGSDMRRSKIRRAVENLEEVIRRHPG
ncbi:MAG TPA: HAD domain-containing protein [Pseudolabrys sp.]|nr:HAD domain-containing protein [Pseudolabrys sp.]